MSCLTQLECLNCRQHIDQSMHRRDGCHYHRGFLQPCDTWMDTDSAQDAHNYRWTCCNQSGTNRGCHWGRHQLPEAALTRTTPPFASHTIQPTRGIKRRMTDDEDSDSSMDDSRSPGFGRPTMPMGRAYSAKLRRLDHHHGSVFGTPSPDEMDTSSYFSISQS